MSANSPEPLDSPSSLVQRNRRRNTALSCQECRRLKLKCSRVFPCSNCVKKGCGQICPTGSLTTGKGNRFVLANTEALHEKINQLANRVRELEDGLQVSHARHSGLQHPLLADDLLQIKRPLERERVDIQTPKEEVIENTESLDAIGSLSISQDGRSRFFGQAANSWYLLQNEGDSEDEEDSFVNHALPNNLLSLSRGFPFASPDNDSILLLRSDLISLLPSKDEAKYLCDTYYRHAAWMYTPISELDFYDSIFRRIYEPDPSHQEPNALHRLAVLFMILALGRLLDLPRPSHAPEANKWYQLGRAALCVDSILEEHSVPGVQALLLMCHFMFLNDIEAPRWVVMGLVVKVAQSLGLHRDSGKWNVDEAETHRRRCLLWELYVYDSWQSLTFGRPPSFSLAHIDSKMPYQDKQLLPGETDQAFSAWKHAFTSQCLSIVHDQAFGARAPSYKILLELDKKVRNYEIPPNLQVPGFGTSPIEETLPSLQLTMQRYIAYAIREMALFYMHRGFFAQAMIESSADPMGSKYGQSVLAAYNSAYSFVGLMNSLYRQQPALTERMWFLFTHVLSCALVLGAIAAKPQMALARSASTYLDSAYMLFNQVSDRRRTTKILSLLQRAKETAYAASSKGTLLKPIGSNIPSSPIIKQEPDEFAALGGTNRLVARRSSSNPSSPAHSSPSPSSQPQSPSLDPSIQQPPVFQGLPAEWSYPVQQPFHYEMSPSAHSQSSSHSNHSSELVQSQMVYMSQSQSNMMESVPNYTGYSQPAPSLGFPYDTYNGNVYAQDLPMPMEYTPPLSDPRAAWNLFTSQQYKV